MIGELSDMSLRRVQCLFIVTLLLNSYCKEKHIENYPNGDIFYEIELKNGLKDGTAKKYYKSGAIMQESEWKDGKKNGRTQTYYENGSIKERINYEDDVQRGIFYEYDTLGQPLKRYEIRDTTLVGVYELFKNGVNVLKGQFSNGHKTGLWNEFDNGGELALEYYVRNDSIIYYKKYSENGDIVKIKLPIKITKDEEKNSFRISLQYSSLTNPKIGVVISSQVTNGIPVDTLAVLESDSLSLEYSILTSINYENRIEGLVFEIDKNTSKFYGWCPFKYDISAAELTCCF